MLTTRAKKSYADVPVTDAGVDTTAFLEASEGLVSMFGMSFILLVAHVIVTDENYTIDLLNSAAFTMVQSDLRNNIAVRSRRATTGLSV